MELSHLVHALKRPLVGFALIGCALFAAKRVLVQTPAQPAPLFVLVPEGASAQQIDRATDEAILLAFAVRAGFIERDPAVRDRLVRNVRFANDALDEDAALRQAVRLDMHRTDAVARQRLIQLAEETIAGATRLEPKDEELVDYMRSHPTRFRTAPTVSFEQVFVGRKHPDFDRRVQQVAANPSRARSDPSLLPATMKRATATRIDARFGVGFFAQLDELETGVWSPPLRSPLGVHFVRIISRREGAWPSLDRVRRRVRHEHERDSRSVRVKEALKRMRAAYRIQVEERT